VEAAVEAAAHLPFARAMEPEAAVEVAAEAADPAPTQQRHR
jgi:hypothetical protein